MKNIWRILSSARSLWPLYVGIIIGAIVTTVTSLLSPFVIAQGTQIVVDMIGGKTNATITTLVWLAVGLLALMVLNSLITNVTGYMGDQMSTRIRAILSHNYFSKLLRLPQRYFDSELTLSLIHI